jgi:hypothetical protein
MSAIADVLKLEAEIDRLNGTINEYRNILGDPILVGPDRARITELEAENARFKGGWTAVDEANRWLNTEVNRLKAIEVAAKVASDHRRTASFTKWMDALDKALEAVE